MEEGIVAYFKIIKIYLIFCSSTIIAKLTKTQNILEQENQNNKSLINIIFFYYYNEIDKTNILLIYKVKNILLNQNVFSKYNRNYKIIILFLLMLQWKQQNILLVFNCLFRK